MPDRLVQPPAVTQAFLQPAVITNLVSDFAATQTATQTSLASQLYGLTSASKASAYLTGSSSDSKPRFVQ